MSKWDDSDDTILIHPKVYAKCMEIIGMKEKTFADECLERAEKATPYLVSSGKMTPEEIAKQAMSIILGGEECQMAFIAQQIRFAVEQERQECAQIARNAPKNKFGLDIDTCEWIELAIRARGEECSG